MPRWQSHIRSSVRWYTLLWWATKYDSYRIKLDDDRIIVEMASFGGAGMALLIRWDGDAVESQANQH